MPKFQFSGGEGAGLCSESGGTLGILNQNLLFSQKPACASQIVSHILRMWSLNNTVDLEIQWPSGLIASQGSVIICIDRTEIVHF